MDKFKHLGSALGHWNHVFCKSMTCKKNLRRDALIILIAILLSAVFIGIDRHPYDKNIRIARVAGKEAKKTSPQEITLAQDSLRQELFPSSISFKQVASSGKETDEKVIEEPKKEEPQIEKIKPQIAPETEKPKPEAPAPKKIVRETRSTGADCIKIPEHILVKLKNPPTPPDAEVKNGKRICHVLAEGEKDNPHKSTKNKKGGWAGCCYDPDEVPNPKCCYPVGSVYEKHLKKYFANPFPLRK